MHTLLVVEDETSVRDTIRRYFAARGWTVLEAATCEQVLQQVSRFSPSAIILDHRLPDGDAVELLPRLREVAPSCAVVVLTGHGTINLAVRAIKGGAEHFLEKPVELATLFALVAQAVPERSSAHAAPVTTGPFAGTSAAIRELEQLARRVADVQTPILIQGETGSGKSMLARWIHENGPRAREAFVDLNCAGLARDLVENELFGHERGAFTGAQAGKQGLLERAHKGTLFLDEIGDLDIAVQPKLLKVLEEKRFRRIGDVKDRTVDVRLIAATNHDIEGLVMRRTFREDLYFRINTVQLHLPPLRERREDIPYLARAILASLVASSRRAVTLTSSAEEALSAYSWPGNIRELRNVLERALVFADVSKLDRVHLHLEPRTNGEVRAAHPEDANTSVRAVTRTSQPSVGGGETLRDLERTHVEHVLRQEAGHIDRAAKRLGMGRSSLYKKIKRWGLVR